MTTLYSKRDCACDQGFGYPGLPKGTQSKPKGLPNADGFLIVVRGRGHDREMHRDTLSLALRKEVENHEPRSAGFSRSQKR